METIPKQKLDLIGIGIGPSNLSTAALLDPVRDVNSIFFESQREFQWYPGMLFPEATIQVSHLKDLVTLVDPTSRFTFLSFLSQQKRLYRFATARFPRIKRREFNQYFRWVVSMLNNLYFETPVQEVSFNGKQFEVVHSRGIATAPNIVVAAGRTPCVPDCVRPHICSTVFHAIQYLQENVKPANKRIVVIGGGQSGAEIVNRLLSNREELPQEVCWISRRSNFLPIDDSPFTNEFFTPAYSDYFFQLPEHEKRRLLHQQTLASDGINLDLLEEIYRNLYEIELIEGRGKIAKLHFNHSLIDFMRGVNGWTLYCRKGEGHEVKMFQADIVIFATGFDSRPPQFLEPLMPRLETCSEGFGINEDFSVRWDGPSTNRIYIQTAARHVRGVADPNLSLMAWRSARIINSLTGRNTYQTDNEGSVFNWAEEIPPREMSTSVIAELNRFIVQTADK